MVQRGALQGKQGGALQYGWHETGTSKDGSTSVGAAEMGGSQGGCREDGGPSVGSCRGIVETEESGQITPTAWAFF